MVIDMSTKVKHLIKLKDTTLIASSSVLRCVQDLLWDKTKLEQIWKGVVIRGNGVVHKEFVANIQWI